MNRDFRFPRSAIVMMLVVLFGIFVAISKARDVQIQYSDSSDLLAVPAAFITLFAVTVVAGALVYAVLYAMKRSGLHRFSSVSAPRPK